jgi:hypothetical protein
MKNSLMLNKFPKPGFLAPARLMILLYKPSKFLVSLMHKRIALNIRIKFEPLNNNYEKVYFNLVL